MKHLYLVIALVLFMSACKKNKEAEIYNENNTNVVNGIVFDIYEKPINGIYKTYYTNGNVKMEMSAKNGIPDGEGQFYDENGNLQYSGTFEQGKINGKFYQYYEDGNVHNELNYINGIQSGAQILYDAKGQISAEVLYDKNKAISGYVLIEGEKIELDADELKSLSTVFEDEQEKISNPLTKEDAEKKENELPSD